MLLLWVCGERVLRFIYLCTTSASPATTLFPCHTVTRKPKINIMYSSITRFGYNIRIDADTILLRCGNEDYVGRWYDAMMLLVAVAAVAMAVTTAIVILVEMLVMMVMSDLCKRNMVYKCFRVRKTWFSVRLIKMNIIIIIILRDDTTKPREDEII